MNYRKIAFLTGAGVSVPSGIRPFRGENGIWEEIDVDRVGSYNSFTDHLQEAWDFWGGVKNQSLDAEPNAIHKFITELQHEYNVTVITQNIDGLHQRAGSLDVIELHGSLMESRCSNWLCDLEPFESKEKYKNIGKCPECGSPLRLNVVAFGENLRNNVYSRAVQAVTDCDIFIAVGTTLLVSPASRLIRVAKDTDSHTVLVNKDITGFENVFAEYHTGRGAEEILPELFAKGFDFAEKINYLDADESINLLYIKHIVAYDSWMYYDTESHLEEKLVLGFTDLIDEILSVKNKKTEEALLQFSNTKFNCDIVLKKVRNEMKGTWYKVKKSFIGDMKIGELWIGPWLDKYSSGSDSKLYIRID